MTDDPTAFLMGGGAPSAKFPRIGDSVSGQVLSLEVAQQTDIDGNKKFYDDGNPMKQLVVTLATSERDPEIQNDKGHRRVFVKGQMRSALRDAVQAAGQTGPEAGANLTVTYVADQPSTKRGYNALKIYAATYTPPVAGAAAAAASQEYLTGEEPF